MRAWEEADVSGNLTEDARHLSNWMEREKAMTHFFFLEGPSRVGN